MKSSGAGRIRWLARLSIRLPRLLPILLAALGATACGRAPIADQVKAVRLSLPGWQEDKPTQGMRAWRDADGDVLGLAACEFPVDPSSGIALQRYARELAESRGGGLIEVTMVAPRPRPIVSLIYKRLRRPAYMYTGMLIMGGRDTSLVWTIVSSERGMTGVREAIITSEMLRSGELTLESYVESWAQDPYDPSYHGVDRSVLRFLSDDRRYDARFPQHPLSKVRRVLAALPGSTDGAP